MPYVATFSSLNRSGLPHCSGWWSRHVVVCPHIKGGDKTLRVDDDAADGRNLCRQIGFGGDEEERGGRGGLVKQRGVIVVGGVWIG